MIAGFILGLANGATCLATCAPVLLPLLLGCGTHPRQNWSLLAQFLAGRLGGYLLFGVLAWGLGWLARSSGAPVAWIYGLSSLGLAGLLLASGLGKSVPACTTTPGSIRARLAHWPALIPACLGFFTGLNLCPPFLMAFADAAGRATLAESLYFFAAFFLGTSLYFLPAPLLGFLHRSGGVQTVGRMAAILISLYYFYVGTISILGGLFA